MPPLPPSPPPHRPPHPSKQTKNKRKEYTRWQSFSASSLSAGNSFPSSLRVAYNHTISFSIRFKNSRKARSYRQKRPAQFIFFFYTLFFVSVLETVIILTAHSQHGTCLVIPGTVLITFTTVSHTLWWQFQQWQRWHVHTKWWRCNLVKRARLQLGRMAV